MAVCYSNPGLTKTAKLYLTQLNTASLCQNGPHSFFYLARYSDKELPKCQYFPPLNPSQRPQRALTFPPSLPILMHTSQNLIRLPFFDIFFSPKCSTLK